MAYKTSTMKRISTTSSVWNGHLQQTSRSYPWNSPVDGTAENLLWSRSYHAWYSTGIKLAASCRVTGRSFRQHSVGVRPDSGSSSWCMLPIRSVFDLLDETKKLDVWQSASPTVIHCQHFLQIFREPLNRSARCENPEFYIWLNKIPSRTICSFVSYEPESHWQ